MHLTSKRNAPSIQAKSISYICYILYCMKYHTCNCRLTFIWFTKWVTRINALSTDFVWAVSNAVNIIVITICWHFHIEWCCVFGSYILYDICVVHNHGMLAISDHSGCIESNVWARVENSSYIQSAYLLSITQFLKQHAWFSFFHDIMSREMMNDENNDDLQISIWNLARIVYVRMVTSELVAQCMKGPPINYYVGTWKQNINQLYSRWHSRPVV